MKDLIKIKGKAFQVFDIIERLAKLHPDMTLKEYAQKMS